MGKYNTLGDRIKKLRQSLFLSQSELAQQLHCTQAALSQYESGNREPGLQELVRIAKALHTSTDYLLGLTKIKCVNTDIKMIGDYLGLTEESIQTLHKYYWERKKKICDDYIQEEVGFHSGAMPGDESYEQDYAFVLEFGKTDLEDYVKFINEFICSSAFNVLSSCMCSNLFIERTIYDLMHILVKQYDKVESPAFTTNIAEKAYCLTEQSEDFIEKYSLNVFEAQSAVLDFCKEFTHLEDVKKLQYKESFYRRLVFYIYHYTHKMFESQHFSVDELEENFSKDEFKMLSQIIELLKVLEDKKTAGCV